MEVFKTITDFETYQISDKGKVISNTKGSYKFLKPQKDGMGYYHVRLYPTDPIFGVYPDGRGKIPKLEKIHRLVALHFVDNPNPELYTEVNHKDGNKTNNIYTNLEWVSRKENIRHAHRLGLHDEGIKRGGQKRKRPVKITHKDGTVKYYQSRTEAMLDLKCGWSTVSSKVSSKTFGKLGWMAEEVTELPMNEYYQKIENIEQLILQYREKYFEHYKNRKLREEARKANG